MSLVRSQPGSHASWVGKGSDSGGGGNDPSRGPSKPNRSHAAEGESSFEKTVNFYQAQLAMYMRREAHHKLTTDMLYVLVRSSIRPGGFKYKFDIDYRPQHPVRLTDPSASWTKHNSNAPAGLIQAFGEIRSRADACTKCAGSKSWISRKVPMSGG